MKGTYEPVIHHTKTMINDEDNDRILDNFTKSEFHLALLDMHPDKSPGPNNFNPAFYQNLWDLYGDDIFGAAKGWLNQGFFPNLINDTNIYLIPKHSPPKNMKDF